MTAGGIYEFQIARDSSRVVYSASPTTGAAEDLYSVLLGGGDPVEASAYDVSSYQLSPDGAQVIYHAKGEPLATISITISDNDPRPLYLPLVIR